MAKRKYYETYSDPLDNVYARMGDLETAYVDVLNIAPETNEDIIDVTGTNLTSAAFTDIDLTAYVSGSLFDIDLSTSEISSNTAIIDIADSRDHDDSGADTYDGLKIAMSGDFAGTSASTTKLVNVDYSGTLNNSAILYGIYSDISGTLSGGTYAAGYFTEGTNTVTLASGTQALTVDGEIDNRDMIEIYDDFNYQTLLETSTPWALHNAAGGVDPAIIAARFGGAIVLNTTAGSTNDASQISSTSPVQVGSAGGAVFETKLHINTAVTNTRLVAGFTDISTIETPASIGGADAITTNATDGCFFVYDTGADTDEWFAVTVDTDVDGTGSGATGVAPVADTDQVLRIEVDADGEGAKFYIDGTLVKTITAAATAIDTDLFATIAAHDINNTACSADVDYIYAACRR